MIQEAIDTCPVDCIHWMDYTEVKQREQERKHQVIPMIGVPADAGVSQRQRNRS
jgi:ferredoxin